MFSVNMSTCELTTGNFNKEPFSFQHMLSRILDQLGEKINMAVNTETPEIATVNFKDVEIMCLDAANWKKKINTSEQNFFYFPMITQEFYSGDQNIQKIDGQQRMPSTQSTRSTS